VAAQARSSGISAVGATALPDSSWASSSSAEPSRPWSACAASGTLKTLSQRQTRCETLECLYKLDAIASANDNPDQMSSSTHRAAGLASPFWPLRALPAFTSAASASQNLLITDQP
jgi:hypothetical protein